MPLLTRGGGEWKDTNVGPDNVYIIKFYPEQMQSIYGVYDYKIHHYKLKFKEPNDIYLEGQLACCVEKVVIRRKKDSVPQNIEDGELAGTIYKREFFRHYDEYWVDQELVPNIGDIYYYKAFPVSTMGFINESTMNEVHGLVAKEHELYGFDMDLNETNPAKIISYPEDVDNTYFSAAEFQKRTSSPNLKCDWDDVWFMREMFPCLLRSNGTVYRKLSKRDFSKYSDDITPSLYSDENSDLDVMIAFPLIYTKYWYSEDTNMFHVRFSDRALDDDYHAYAHMNDDDEILPFIYIAAYRGSYYNEKIRSLYKPSKVNPGKSIGAADMFGYKKPCSLRLKDSTNQKSWGYLEYSDLLLLQMIMLMVFKTTNFYIAPSYYSSNRSTSSSLQDTPIGTSSKCMFYYGTANNLQTTGNCDSKILFGLADFVDISRPTLVRGLLFKDNKPYVKMTRKGHGENIGDFYAFYNDTVGSTDLYVRDRSIDKYEEVSDVLFPSFTTNPSYISKISATPYGLFPIECNGTASTGLCTYIHRPKMFNDTDAYYIFTETGYGGGTYANTAAEAAAKTLFSYFCERAGTTNPSISVYKIRLNCKPKLETFKYDEFGNLVENWNDPEYAEADE